MTIVIMLWSISAFLYFTSLLSLLFDSNAKVLGLMSIALLFLGSLTTRSKTYLALYDSRTLRASGSKARALLYVTRVIFYASIFAFAVVSFYYFREQSVAHIGSNSILLIFGLWMFLAGKWLLLLPLEKP